MDDKLGYIPNDDTQNYALCRLKLKKILLTSLEPTNHNLIVTSPNINLSIKQKLKPMCYTYP